MAISNKSSTFATPEPAKPLNDAQMCGSFCFYTMSNKQNPIPKAVHQCAALRGGGTGFRADHLPEHLHHRLLPQELPLRVGQSALPLRTHCRRGAPDGSGSHIGIQSAVST